MHIKMASCYALFFKKFLCFLLGVFLMQHCAKVHKAQGKLFFFLLRVEDFLGIMTSKEIHCPKNIMFPDVVCEILFSVRLWWVVPR